MLLKALHAGYKNYTRYRSHVNNYVIPFLNPVKPGYLIASCAHILRTYLCNTHAKVKPI